MSRSSLLYIVWLMLVSRFTAQLQTDNFINFTRTQNLTSFRSYDYDIKLKMFKIEVLLRLLLKTNHFEANDYSYILHNAINDAVNEYWKSMDKLKLARFNDNVMKIHQDNRVPIEWVKNFNSLDFTYCNSIIDICRLKCPINFMFQIDFDKYWCALSFERRKKRSFNELFLIDKRKMLNEVVNELIREYLEKNLKFTILNKNSPTCKTNGLGNLYDSRICIDINECENSQSMYCDTNAICVNKFGSYECKCRNGYYGDGKPNHCFNNSYCSGKYCKLNGYCVFRNNIEGYKCTCGLNCLNGGRCVMRKTKYECDCPFNTTGKLCERISSTEIIAKGFASLDFENILANIMKNDQIESKVKNFNDFKYTNLILDHVKNIKNSMFFDSPYFTQTKLDTIKKENLLSYLKYLIMRDQSKHSKQFMNDKVLNYDEFELLKSIEDYAHSSGKSLLEMIIGKKTKK